mmetsp:Transcript_14561/g.40973  ORF Transcript_14561/g.40973 Transcript_14561/m.40973 type:complete len:375 (+) Transcript_14561:199-1323(+)
MLSRGVDVVAVALVTLVVVQGVTSSPGLVSGPSRSRDSQALALRVGGQIRQPRRISASRQRRRHQEKHLDSSLQVSETQKKRVALCFYGVARTTRYALPFIKKFLLDELESYFEVDRYMHTYDVMGWNNKGTNANHLEFDPEDYKLLGPFKQVQVSTHDEPLATDAWRTWIKDGKDPWRNRFQSLRNLYCGLYSLKMVTKLWLESGIQYDAVIIARPDLAPVSKVPVHLIQALDSKTVYTPGWHTWGGYNDRFSFGDAEVMQQIGSRFDCGQRFVEVREKSVHAESLVKFVTFENNFTNTRIPYQLERVRSGGRMQESFKPTRATGGNKINPETAPIACHEVLKALNLTMATPLPECAPGAMPECTCTLPLSQL